MVERRAVQIGVTVWALAGFALAAASVPALSADARVLVGLAAVIFPLCAVLAAFALARGQLRAAGVLLLLSVATPTYFAWPVNGLALLVGVALVLAPGLIVRSASSVTTT